jgi:cytochrome b
MESAINSPTTLRWNWLVRVVHWSVAGLFFANYFFTDHGYPTHQKVGWAVLILVGIRLLWGISFAKAPSSLASFFPTPARFKEHIQELKTRAQPEQVGHNALGALAIFFMWGALVVAVLSGWLYDTDWAWDNGYEDTVHSIHETTVDLIFYVVCVHIAAVILMSFWSKRNLIKAMIIGRF